MSKDIEAPCGLERFLIRASAASGLDPMEIAALLRLHHTALISHESQPVVDRSDSILLVKSGILTQTRQAGAGARQIVGFFLPGELANLPRALGDAPSAIFHVHPGTACHVIRRHEVLDATRGQPELLRAFLHEVALEARRAQDWLVNIGIRRAQARIAHFFVEYTSRLDRAGLKRQGYYDLPFSQSVLADILGLSLVHTNKSYRALANAGLVLVKNQRLVVNDYDGLCRCAGTERDTESLSLSPQRESPFIGAGRPTEHLQPGD